MNYDQLSCAEIDAMVAEAIGEYVDGEGDRVELRRAPPNMDDTGRVDLNRIDNCGAEMSWPDLDEKEGDVQWFSWRPSQGGECEDVKREIERRGWGWSCDYHAPTKRYNFIVHIKTMPHGIFFKNCSAETEARACCVAFLRAVEATKVK